VAKLEVHVVTPEREVYAGDVDMVVARAVDGELGVLAGHIPMLVPLGIGVLALVDGGQRTQVAIDGGFLHVISGGGSTRVDVLAEHASLAKDIDLAGANREREEAERAVASSPTPEARDQLARAQARVRVAGG
jgi:F-type H+-transporting ATPase subunit epsilon